MPTSKAMTATWMRLSARCGTWRELRQRHHNESDRQPTRMSLESGLADRVAALGGSLRAASSAGRGTAVEAELPCVS
jgi:hypothetical protein